MDPHVPPSHACLTSLTPCSRSYSLIRLEQSVGHTAFNASDAQRTHLKTHFQVPSFLIGKSEAIWV